MDEEVRSAVLLVVYSCSLYVGENYSWRFYYSGCADSYDMGEDCTQDPGSLTARLSFIRGCPLGLPGTRSRRRVHVSPSAAPFASPRRYEHSSKLHLLSRSSPRRRAGTFPVFCVFLGLHTWNPQCYLKQ